MVSSQLIKHEDCGSVNMPSAFTNNNNNTTTQTTVATAPTTVNVEELQQQQQILNINKCQQQIVSNKTTITTNHQQQQHLFNVNMTTTSTAAAAAAAATTTTTTIINSPKMGSRRIFTPQFKLQVLESYRNDNDCKGNQRATARKYNIHRRQIQKWLQCESNLRSSVANINQSQVKHQFHNLTHHHHQQQQQPMTTAHDNNNINNNNSQFVSHQHFTHHHQQQHHTQFNVPSSTTVPTTTTTTTNSTITPIKTSKTTTATAVETAAAAGVLVAANFAAAVAAAAASTLSTDNITTPTVATAISSPIRPTAIIGNSADASLAHLPVPTSPQHHGHHLHHNLHHLPPHHPHHPHAHLHAHHHHPYSTLNYGHHHPMAVPTMLTHHHHHQQQQQLQQQHHHHQSPHIYAHTAALLAVAHHHHVMAPPPPTASTLHHHFQQQQQQHELQESQQQTSNRLLCAIETPVCGSEKELLDVEVVDAADTESEADVEIKTLYQNRYGHNRNSAPPLSPTAATTAKGNKMIECEVNDNSHNNYYHEKVSMSEQQQHQELQPITVRANLPYMVTIMEQELDVDKSAITPIDLSLNGAKRCYNQQQQKQEVIEKNDNDNGNNNYNVSDDNDVVDDNDFDDDNNNNNNKNNNSRNQIECNQQKERNGFVVDLTFRKRKVIKAPTLTTPANISTKCNEDNTSMIKTSNGVYNNNDDDDTQPEKIPKFLNNSPIESSDNRTEIATTTPNGIIKIKQEKEQVEHVALHDVSSDVSSNIMSIHNDKNCAVISSSLTAAPNMALTKSNNNNDNITKTITTTTVNTTCTPAKPIKLFKPYLLDNDDDSNTNNNSNEVGIGNELEDPLVVEKKNAGQRKYHTTSDMFVGGTFQETNNNHKNIPHNKIDTFPIGSPYFPSNISNSSSCSGPSSPKNVSLFSPTSPTTITINSNTNHSTPNGIGCGGGFLSRCSKGSPVSGYESSSSTYSECSSSAYQQRCGNVNGLKNSSFALDLQLRAVYNEQLASPTFSPQHAHHQHSHHYSMQQQQHQHLILHHNTHVQSWLDHETTQNSLSSNSSSRSTPTPTPPIVTTPPAAHNNKHNNNSSIIALYA